MKFGDYLRQKREARGWTQPDAANKAGIEQSYLSKLETGKSYPSEDVYARLVAAYEIDADELVRQVGSAEVAKLREIGEVRAAVLDAQNGRKTFERGWMVAGLFCLTASGACLGLFLLAKDTVRTEWDYVSLGVLSEGEPLEAFDIALAELDQSDPNYDAKMKQRNAMIPRLDQKKLTSRGNFGFNFIEKVDKGLRYYRLQTSRKVEEPSPLHWFLVPALALFAAAVGCGNLSLRWK
jgi:transcriptional regulator with XRE-family HTH domain